MTEESPPSKQAPEIVKNELVEEQWERIPKAPQYDVSYVCPSCDTKFSRKTACAAHMRICKVKGTNDADSEFDYYDAYSSDTDDYFEDTKKSAKRRRKANKVSKNEIEDAQIIPTDSGVQTEVKHIQIIGNIMSEFIDNDIQKPIDNNVNEERDDYIIEELKNVERVSVQIVSEEGGSIEAENESFENVIEQSDENTTVQESFKQKGGEKPPDVSIYEFVDEEDDFREEQRRMDLEKKNRTCKYCKLVFEDPMEVLRHTRTAHAYPKIWLPSSEVLKHMNAKDKSRCPICGKPLSSKYLSQFIKHLKTHTEDYQYQCKVCKLVFRRKDHMKNHESRHIVGI